jgi:hypothetical protein
VIVILPILFSLVYELFVFFFSICFYQQRLLLK